jgi:hypothetical protein
MSHQQFLEKKKKKNQLKIFNYNGVSILPRRNETFTQHRLQSQEPGHDADN